MGFNLKFGGLFTTQDKKEEESKTGFNPKGLIKQQKPTDCDNQQT